MKAILKRLADFVAGIIVLPCIFLYWIFLLLFGEDRAVQWISQRSSRWGGVMGEYLRRAVLRNVLEYVGSDVVISFGTIFSHRQVRIESGVYIGAYCVIGRANIGCDTLIADGVIIPSGRYQHKFERIDIPIKEQAGKLETIHIGRDCWIGSRAVILADIGDGCVISAGATVKEVTGNYEILAGNPAKVVKRRANQ